jgi:hypothetical protein
MNEQSRAKCRFFQCLPYRFGADRIDETEDRHLVSQQLQCPMASATGRVRAGQLDQLLLDVPFDLDLVWTRRLRPVSLDVHPASECPQETGACLTRQLEIDRPYKRTFGHVTRSISRRNSTESPVNRRLTDQ